MVGMHHNTVKPFALSISPTTISASRLDSSGSVEVLTYPVSPEYMRYYHEIATQMSPDSQGASWSESETNPIFQHLIALVTEDLQQRLGYELQYAAIFAPSIFESVRGLATSKWIPKTTSRKLSSPDPLEWRHAQGMHSWNVGTSVVRWSSAEMKTPKTWSLYSNMRKIICMLGLCRLDSKWGYIIRLKESFVSIAERFRFRSVFSTLESAKLIWSWIMGAKAYEEKLGTFIKGFLESEVFPEHKQEDIRAIIISGEASAAGNARLGALAIQAVGTDEVQLMTEIESSKAVAHGAAVWAQLTYERPRAFLSPDGNRIADEQYHIDEELRRRHKHDGL